MGKAIKDLINAARGALTPDLVIKHGRVINTFTCEIEDVDVAIHNGVIAGLGRYEGRDVIDAKGAFLCPGFIDGHLHIESTMLSPAEFSRCVLPLGTTAVVADPHEIANVLGRRGIDYMLDSSAGLPVDIYIMVPSCVPATDMETSGARLKAEDLVPFRANPRVLGLAEVMNFPGVIFGSDEVLAKIEAFEGAIIDGHSPLLSGRDLNAYILAGPHSDHECTVLEEAQEKVRRGMYIMIREGTQAKNLKQLLPLVTPVSSRRFMFVTDDLHPDDLRDKGHLNHLLDMAISGGLDPLTAIQMVTLNPANYFGLKGAGAIAPGYNADILLLSSLSPVRISSVFKRGRMVYAEGRIAFDFPPPHMPDHLTHMNIGRYAVESFRINAEGDKDIRVIGLIEDQIITQECRIRPKTEKGVLPADLDRDILKIAVLERHNGTGNIGLGFVKGFGIKEGAIASSIAHDSHNIIAVGVDDQEIFMAVKEIEEMKGGAVVVSRGKVLARLPLPIAGLMSDRPLSEVAVAWKRVEEGAKSIGGKIHHPFMALSFLALPVIPSLKITDRGLVDVGRFEPVGLFV